MPLRRYADFSGRSRRMEYWMYVLLLVLCEIVLMTLISIVGLTSGDKSGFSFIGGGLAAIFGLAVIVPTIAVQVRRFHDQDRSGWFVLLGLIPFIGGLILLVFMCLEGTNGPNRFGPDPKAEAAA